MTTLYDISEKVYKLERSGKKIIKFNVGDPDQSTDERIVKACMESIQKGFTKYSSSTGEMVLRSKLAEEHGVKPENVFISPGSKLAIYAAMSVLLKNGDNIILPSPHWNAYDLIARNLGANVKFLKTRMEDNWQIDPAKLEEAIDGKTKLIVLCNPGNPTSAVVNQKVMDSIIEIAARKKVLILSDECYADISFKKVKSITEYGNENICIKSFSKTFAMTGWRVGYAVAKSELIDKFTKFAQISITNVPVFVQHAAAKALDFKAEQAKMMQQVYLKRAEMAMKALGKTKLKMQKPDAPFYLFPYCGEDTGPVALNLIDKGVAIAPGEVFGDYKQYFRLALTLPDAEIRSGLDIMASEFKG